MTRHLFGKCCLKLKMTLVARFVFTQRTHFHTQSFYGRFSGLPGLADGHQRFTRKPLEIDGAIFFTFLMLTVVSLSTVACYICKCTFDKAINVSAFRMCRIQCTMNNFRFCWCDQRGIFWCSNYICYKNW